MKAWLAKHMPVPMAAPETAELRAARFRLIAAMLAIGVMTLFWSAIGGPLALSVLVGLAVFICVQGFVWLRAKNIADDDHLMSGRSENE
jgi:fatty acid desaturase